jgi:hypothetical protein
MTTPINPEKLSAYAVGELDEAEARALEAQLADDPEAQALVEEFRGAAQHLQAAFESEPALRLDAPRREAVQQVAAQPRRKLHLLRGRWKTLHPLVKAAAVVCCVLGAIMLSDGIFPQEAQKYDSNNWFFAETPQASSVIVTDLGADPYGPPGNGGFDPRGGLDSLGYISNNGLGEVNGVMTDKTYSYDINGDGMGESIALGAAVRTRGHRGGGDDSRSARGYFSEGNASKMAFFGRSKEPVPQAKPEPTREGNAKPEPPTFAAPQPDRYLIKNAVLAMEVVNARDVAEQLTSVCKTSGGYVADYRETLDNLGHGYVSLQIRVPATQLEGALLQLNSLGKVLSKQVTTEDVTEEYVDNEARTRNLKKAEERLLSHFDRVRKLEEVVAVEKELTRTRETIERLEGRLKYLSHRVAYSTIHITLQEKPAAEPIRPPESFSSAKVFSEALRGLLTWARGLWVRLIWIAVWSPVWGSFLLVGGISVWRWRRGR